MTLDACRRQLLDASTYELIEDAIGLGKAALDVSVVPARVRRHVRVLLLPLDPSRVLGEVRVQRRGVGGHGGERIQHGLELLVLDLDQAQRLLGDAEAVSGDGGDLLAGEADHVAREHGDVPQGPAHEHLGEVRARENGVHAG